MVCEIIYFSDFHGFFLTEKKEKFFQFGSRNSSFIGHDDNGIMVENYEDRVQLTTYLKSIESEYRDMWFLKHSQMSYTSFEESGISPDREVSLLISIHRADNKYD